MPDTAELIISCRGTGTQEVKRFTDAVREADHSSNELIKTTGMLFSTAQMLRYARASVQAFKTQEKASTGLRSALQRLGGEYQAYQSEMEKFSAEMQEMTIYGDQQITMIQAMGLNMGILPNKIQEATKAALGLSAAYNMNVNTSMRLIARAAKGHTEILSRYGIVLDKTKSKEEQYAELLDLGTGNMKLVTSEAQTLRGVLAQAGNAFGDAQEKVGEEFAPAIRDAAGLIKNLSEMFSGASGSTRRFIVLTGALTGALTALKGAAGAKNFLADLTKATPGGKNAVDMVNAETAARGKNASAIRTENQEMASRPAMISEVPKIEAETAARSKNIAMIEAEKRAKAGVSGKVPAASRDALTYLTKQEQNREQRAQLVRVQEATEKQSEDAAKRLQAGDAKLKQARVQLKESARGVKETSADWTRSVKALDEAEKELERRNITIKPVLTRDFDLNALEKNLSKQETAVKNLLVKSKKSRDFRIPIQPKFEIEKETIEEYSLKSNMLRNVTVPAPDLSGIKAEITARQANIKVIGEEQAARNYTIKAPDVSGIMAETKARVENLKVIEAEKAARNISVSGINNQNAALSVFRKTEAEDRAEVRYQLGLRTETQKSYEAQIEKVNELQREMKSANDAVRQANAALKKFDAAREAERQNQMKQPEVRAAVVTRQETLNRGGSIGEAEANALAVYNRELEKHTAQAALASEADLKQATALKLGASESEALAVREAYLAEASMSTTGALEAETAAIQARQAALAHGMSAAEAETAATAAYNQVLKEHAAQAEMAKAAEESKNAALARGATATQAAAIEEAKMIELQRAAHQAEKPRLAAIKARNAALANGASVTAAEAAAVKAYNQALAEQAARAALAAEAENAKNAALARGATVTQANAVKTEVLAKAEQRAALQSTMLGRAQLAVAGGAAKAAAGLRGAAVAAGGLVKPFLPMLAISAAIAGIDYLINRTKKAAEGMAEIAGKEADRARAALTTGDQERASDQEKLRRYEELASYADRTADEQRELIDLAKDLNGRYKDLVIPLLYQNQTLERTVGLWGKIREAQRKAREEQLKEAVRQSNRQLEAETLRVQEQRLTGAETVGSMLVPWKTRGDEKRLNWKEINALPYQQRMGALESLRNVYKKSNNSAMFTEITNYIERLKAARKLQQELFDLQIGKGSETGNRETGKSLKETSKESRRLLEMALANEERDVDEYLSGYSKLREIYSLEGDRLKRKQLISDLNKEELEDYDHEIKQQQKLLNDINQRIKVSGNAEARQKSVKIAERLIELTRQRAEIESNAVRRDFEEMKQAEQENRNFFNSIQQSLFRMRETAGNAIDANSNEAIRLQSRQFLSGGKNLDYQKINAENSKKMNELLKKMQEIETKVQNEVTQIRAAIDKNLRTSTVGG